MQCWTLVRVVVLGLLATGTHLTCTGDRILPAQESREEMVRMFAAPPMSCRPHTRWWWMGNAITKEELTWQLAQMHEKGIGGVEQITMQEVYKKGNVPYLSKEYFDLLRHAIGEARDRGMEFSLNFGGPGWVIGGAWVPKEDRSQNMIPTMVQLTGGQRFSGSLPTAVGAVPRTGQIRARNVTDDDRLVAVVAGRVTGQRLDKGSLVDLTDRVKGRQLSWDIPAGSWQLMAFWLQYTGQECAVDHVNKAAIERYCDYLGNRFRDALGADFGATVESLFCDSFEVALLDNGIYWSDGLLALFEARSGYDLTRLLPAIWWDVGPITPKIRYDVNEFLSEVGLEAFFKTFLDWCAANGVRGRIQPYGFTTDIIAGSGLTHLPEMEITPGEKDAVPWFDTRIGPKKYVASGAHLYGRNVVTVEAYTYLHWEPCRATLEELKIASDGFLRAGANKFYNHGFTCSPERDFALSRRFGAEMLMSPPNVWWGYYRLLSDYLTRCCYLLRQGDFVADIAVYSPLANQWTRDVRNARKWTRNFDWGGLGELLMANGYDFDLLNDDVLQNHASTRDGILQVRNLEYRILLLPNIEALPLETLRRIEQYARHGGVVVALERVPEYAVGLADYQRQDTAVRAIVAQMFDTPVWRRNPTAPRDYGQGKTYHIRYVIDRSDVLERHSSALDPFLNTLRRHVRPDFGIDFVRAELRANGGLAFIHRRLPDQDIYFVTNIQDRAVDMPVAFRVTGRPPSRWDPYRGQVTPLAEYREETDVTWLPVRLGPYQSTFFVFGDEPARAHVTHSTLAEIRRVHHGTVEATARDNGAHRVAIDNGAETQIAVTTIPGVYQIAGRWQLTLTERDGPPRTMSLARLVSWTDHADSRHFSGTGVYTIDFDLPEAYHADALQLYLSLGVVGNVAEVELNGQSVGTCWIRGQELDITAAARTGTNTLTVRVTNTLINRVAGWKEVPPVPDHLVARYGHGLERNLGGARGVIGFQPLPNSGLLGPVVIRPAQRVVLPIER